ncbi:MAG: ATP-binding cassette domain-containing protein [Gammaproteobacteria bacterium]|nr:ATP-binding cassette domain-containing protein [Gammaproteobacteria bacterium]
MAAQPDWRGTAGSISVFAQRGRELERGSPRCAREHMIQATSDAAIHESIENLTNGYDAMVGERGVTLSGGQRQRLALARALLKDPAVLVLDDSLSAVDTGTEARILAALKARKGRHTTLVIAHRLSSVRDADRIIVLDHGRLAQVGDHDTLIAQPGTYRRLCEIQGALDEQIARDVAKTKGRSHV